LRCAKNQKASGAENIPLINQICKWSGQPSISLPENPYSGIEDFYLITTNTSNFQHYNTNRESALRQVPKFQQIIDLLNRVFITY
jgi:hypothetical protein